MASTEPPKINQSLQKVSMTLYMGLCLEIGTKEQISIRRDVKDIEDLFSYKTSRIHDYVFMSSGSKREGFRLSGSDIDTMSWPNDHRILWDFSQIKFYNLHNQVLVLCDNTESPPGFTLLWLPFEKTICAILTNRDNQLPFSLQTYPTLIEMHGVLYISSAKYREIKRTINSADATIHGPCTNRKYANGIVEFDDVNCLVCDFWPPSAFRWINRCRRHLWPSRSVVENIVQNGCHLVPIGHKMEKHVDNEWRISFSQAEQKLVYEMNHTQFLIYGLLKIILKEIINRDVGSDEKLLCSYHMKTAIFWAIQHNTITHWAPEYLLEGFWVCFKLLLRWVHEGVCPNFFIPENNMFLNKVHSSAQRNLFAQMYGLYEKGIAFLLLSPSVSSYIIGVLCNPELHVCLDERTIVSKFKLDLSLFCEIDETDSIPANYLQCHTRYLSTIEQLLRYPLTLYQVFMLQKLKTTVLQISSFQLRLSKTPTVNRDMYIVEKRSCQMLKSAAKSGFFSELLYIAMYYYKTNRYEDALSVIEKTKVRSNLPGGEWQLVVTENFLINLTDAHARQSWSLKMKHAAPKVMRLYDDIQWINELTLEHQSNLQTRRISIGVPVSIIFPLLEFLSCRHINQVRAHRVLERLQELIHKDNGLLVPLLLRDISWEILGICQQMAGNFKAARFSYEQSLKQYPFNGIQAASMLRIQFLQLHENPVLRFSRCGLGVSPMLLALMSVWFFLSGARVSIQFLY